MADLTPHTHPNLFRIPIATNFTLRYQMLKLSLQFLNDSTNRSHYDILKFSAFNEKGKSYLLLGS